MVAQAEQVARLAEGATIREVEIPPDAAEPRYRPSAKLAEFVRCRDLTCRFPGCDRPAQACDLDHTVPYPAGPTHPSDLKCLCRFHHLLKTFHGWTDHQYPDGTVVWTAPTQFSGETRGVIPDQDNNLWQISRTGARVMKYRGTDGAPLGMVSVGNQPYTYSDASGSTVIGQTSPSGSWTVTFDSGTAGSPWAPVWWNDSVPAGASLSVRVRTADTPADLPLKAWTNVTKGGPIALTGRYIEAQANFATTTGSPSPVLYDLTLATPNVGKCDADQDGDIDQADLALISKARGQTPTANDPRDANGDGRIDPLDVKTCIPRCTRANCAIQ